MRADRSSGFFVALEGITCGERVGAGAELHLRASLCSPSSHPAGEAQPRSSIRTIELRETAHSVGWSANAPVVSFGHTTLCSQLTLLLCKRERLRDLQQSRTISWVTAIPVRTPAVLTRELPVAYGRPSSTALRTSQVAHWRLGRIRLVFARPAST